MRKTKSEGKTVGIFAISSQGCEIRNAKFRNAKNHSEFRNAKNHLAMRKSIWQCEKPFGNAKNHLRKFMFFFFSSDFQYMLQNLHKTSKIKAIKIA